MSNFKDEQDDEEDDERCEFDEQEGNRIKVFTFYCYN